MREAVLRALKAILEASDAASYLAAQDRLVPELRLAYAGLCDVARSHGSADIRWEALQMVSLLRAPDHRLVLEAAMREDAETAVREGAKALVFRSVVREKVVESGKLTPEKLAAYDEDVRRQAALRFFTRSREQGA